MKSPVGTGRKERAPFEKKKTPTTTLLPAYKCLKLLPLEEAGTFAGGFFPFILEGVCSFFSCLELQILSLQQVPCEGPDWGQKPHFLGMCLIFLMAETIPLSTMCRSALENFQEGKEGITCVIYWKLQCQNNKFSPENKWNWVLGSRIQLALFVVVLCFAMGSWTLLSPTWSRENLLRPESGGNMMVQKSKGIFSLSGM